MTPAIAISNHDNPTSTSSHGPTFAIFNRLPIKLRLKTWEAALPELECLFDFANLKLVQNLAVLLDPDADQITNTARPNKLANILFFFGNVKNLTLVLGHFDREGDDQGDILFMEPKTCHNYETISSVPSQHQDVLDVPLNTTLVSTAELERSLEEWKRLLEEHIEGDDLAHLPVPQIEYKSAVTGGLKRHLDYLRNIR
jgi:hypothetical protein